MIDELWLIIDDDGGDGDDDDEDDDDDDQVGFKAGVKHSCHVIRKKCRKQPNTADKLSVTECKLGLLSPLGPLSVC